MSVVIAASESPGAVARALATLPEAPDLEILVVAPESWPVEANRCHWISAEPGADVPTLRRLGLDRSLGEIVALTEDSCGFGPGWVDSWRVAFQNPEILAASGPVSPAMGDRPIDLAVFFCEYAPFSPLIQGEEWSPGRLAGNNFAIRRSLADRLNLDRIEESEVEQAIGQASAWSGEALAYHLRRYSLAEAFRDRLRFGHGYGKARAADRPIPWRLLGLWVGPLILLAQVFRVTRDNLRRGRDLDRFVEVFPITVALLTAWSVGEWLGWASSAFVRRSSRK